jgi:hypothetical protein
MPAVGAKRSNRSPRKFAPRIVGALRVTNLDDEPVALYAVGHAGA